MSPEGETSLKGRSVPRWGGKFVKVMVCSQKGILCTRVLSSPQGETLLKGRGVSRRVDFVEGLGCSQEERLCRRVGVFPEGGDHARVGVSLEWKTVQG